MAYRWLQIYQDKRRLRFAAKNVHICEVEGASSVMRKYKVFLYHPLQWTPSSASYLAFLSKTAIDVCVKNKTVVGSYPALMTG